MEKRLLLATFLSIAILILFQYIYGPRRPVRDPHKPDKPEKVIAKPQRSEEEESFSKKDLAINATDFTFETNLAKVVLTNHGGRIKAIYLKKYTTNNNHHLVNLIKTSSLEDDYPVTIKFDDPDITYQANNGLYEVYYNALTTTQRQPKESITFRYTDPQGIRYTKDYLFNHDSYLIKFRTSIENLPEKERKKPFQILWATELGDSAVNNAGSSDNGPMVYLNKKIIKYELKDSSSPTDYYGELSWVAFRSKYFAIALISPEKVSTATIDRSYNQGLGIGFKYLIEDSRVGKEFTIYAGPKETQRLNSAHPDLGKLIDFGWFSFLAIPLLQLLKYSYRFTHNYGLSIILMTVMIKIVFYPLSHKSYQSMRKMQELQPKIKLIQERYKKDQEKLNQETLALYREYKVNPLGGCLPMVLQIPVFFALYRVFLNAIELRNAPFIWWIKDLSEKDPYYFWPILMGLSMFIQQKMTPPMGDPRQNRMMLMMPVIFTVMFLKFPVGLVIYWLVNNLLSIVQQYLMTRNVSKPRAA